MTHSNTLARYLLSGVAGLGMACGLVATTGTLAIVTASPAAACDSEPLIGSICTFSFDWCPRGYLPADGRSVAVRENQALFSLLGYRYGGNNADIFNVPDLRGRSVVAKGTAPGLNAVNFAEKVGQQSVVLTPSQVPLVPHTHNAAFQGTGGGKQTVSVPANAGSLGVTSKLQAIKTQGVATPDTGSLLGMGGSAALQAPIYVASGTSGTKVDLGGLDVQLTGTAGYGAINFEVPTGITGGTVTVAPAAAAATKEVSTQSPGMGMTVCIVANGLYPDRP